MGWGGRGLSTPVTTCWSSQAPLLTAFIATPGPGSILCLQRPCGHHSASDSCSPNAGGPCPHSALAVHTQQGLAPQSLPPSSSSDHSLPSFQHPCPHVIKLLRDFQSSTSSKPTGHLPAHPSPFWTPRIALSAVHSICTTHPHSVFHLAESQRCIRSILRLLHLTP